LISFSESLRKAHDHGWYIYQAWENQSPKQWPWGVTLREATGGPRRQIAHGSGETLALAIENAIKKGEAILEKEISSSKEPAFDLIAALGIKPKALVRRG